MDANKLKERRLELGLTLEEVAEKVGVGRSTVRKWETGNIAEMGKTNITNLAKALRVSPLFILGDESHEYDAEPSFASETHEVLYQRMQNSSEEKLKRLEKLWDLVDQEFENNP